MKNHGLRKPLLIALLAVFLNIVPTKFTGYGIQQFNQLLTSYNYYDIFFVIFYFFVLYFLINKKDFSLNTNLYTVALTLISIILSSFMTLGVSFRKYGNTLTVFSNYLSSLNSLLYIIGYAVLFYLLVDYCLDKLLQINFHSLNNQNSPKFNFLKVFLIMIVCWMPYLIILYPGTSSWDTVNQMIEFFGRGFTVRDVYPISHYLLQGNSFTISNQHNFFITLFYGTCVKAGLVLFGSANMGACIASATQLVMLALLFTGLLNVAWMYTSRTKQKMLLVFFSLFPLFPIFSIYLVKNVIYAIFIGWFMLLLLKLVLDRNIIKDKFWLFSMFLCSVFQVISQKYGSYVLLVVSIWMLVQYPKLWKRTVLITIIPLFIVKILINGLLFTKLNVATGDPVEGYSIPFQQTALDIKQNPKSVTKSQYKILNKIFYVKNLGALYNPLISDPVKSSGDKSDLKNFLPGYKYKSVTKTEINQYWKVWVQMGLIHPKTYLEAYFNLTFGYLDIGPNERQTSYSISSDNLPLVTTPTVVSASQSGDKTLQSNHRFLKIRIYIGKIYNKMVTIFPFSIILNGTYYVIFSLISFVYLLKVRKSEYILIILPLLIQIPIIMASPVNGNQRYMLPFILLIGIPIMLMCMLNNQERTRKQDE